MVNSFNIISLNYFINIYVFFFFLANGQSIATRIANQIKQVTMKLKKNLKALNTIGGVTITEKEALNPVSPIYLVSVLNQV